MDACLIFSLLSESAMLHRWLVGEFLRWSTAVTMVHLLYAVGSMQLCYLAQRGVQGLAVSTFQVVLVPTLVGVVANEFFHDLVKKFTAWLPLVGVAITTLLCASPCAQVATVLKYVVVRLPTAVDSSPVNST